MLRSFEKGDEILEIKKLPDGPKKKEAIRKLGLLPFGRRFLAHPLFIPVPGVNAAPCNLPMERYLFRDRLELPVTSQVQLAEILLDAHRMDDFKKVMPIISQFLQQDDFANRTYCAPNEGIG